LWAKTSRWVGVLFDYVAIKPAADPEPSVEIGEEEVA